MNDKLEIMGYCAIRNALQVFKKLSPKDRRRIYKRLESDKYFTHKMTKVFESVILRMEKENIC